MTARCIDHERLYARKAPVGFQTRLARGCLSAGAATGADPDVCAYTVARLENEEEQAMGCRESPRFLVLRV